MNFDEWLKGEIEKLDKIKDVLKEKYGNVDRDYQEWLFEDAKEPWGLVKGAQQAGAVAKDRSNMHYSGKGDQKSYGRQLSEKQKKILEQHLEGELGPKIAAMIKEMKKPMDQLSIHEASEIIDFIFRGGKQ